MGAGANALPIPTSNTEPGPMTDTFINKDAQYLFDLGNQLAEGLVEESAMFSTMMKLHDVARKLQAMDERNLALASSDKNEAFDRGVLEGYRRVYERSNIPAEDRVMPVVVQKAGVGVRVMPAGKTLSQINSAAEARKRLAKKQPVVNVTGIKLNLSALRLKAKP
jgi:hypothetical protein